MTPRHILLSFTAALALAGATSLSALSTDHFPRQSVLAQGRWVKIAVTDDGVYRIPASTLRSWGFTDPAKVRIYGMGGARLDDAITEDNVPSDMPMLQHTVCNDGTVVFYAAGAGEWTRLSSQSQYYYDANVYTSRSYYFLTESDEPMREIAEETLAAPVEGRSYPATFTERIHHEKEAFSPGDAGPLLAGEDMRYTREVNIDFTLPSTAAAGAAMGLRVSYLSKFTAGAASITMNLPGCDGNFGSARLNLCSSSTYTHGVETVFERTGTFSSAANSQRVTLSLSAPTTPSLAALNSVTLSYERALEMPSSGSLLFDLDSNSGQFAKGEGTVTVWNVSDPLNITLVPDNSAATLQWNYSSKRTRWYAAWREGAAMPVPTLVGSVDNQNLHGEDSPDMVIITPADFAAQARRLADFHIQSSDSLSVTITDIDQIYNEFSSGRKDPAGIRNYLKMLYDRGLAGEGRPLRYLLIMGRMTVDNRGLIASYGSHPTIPGWTPRGVRYSLSDNEGYFTDDYYAMLDDNGSANMRTDKLRIAVGRIPVTDELEAKSVVDKQLEYALGNRHTAWKQRMVFLADDGDRGVHLNQTETMVSEFCHQDGQPFLMRKVYLDAYTRQGGTYPEARDALYRSLNEGVLWWNFIGHASTTSWTADGILSYTDLNNLYLRHLPFIYAATCNFLRLDAPTVSGAEIMYKQRYGGCIGVISATRPVYIAENGPFSAAVGRNIGRRDASGRLLTPGEIYRLGKNDIRDSKGNLAADDNRLRYIFVGDPALRLAIPDNTVAIDSINGVPADSDEPATVAALSRARISGRILAPDGSLRSGFNGVITIDILDSEYTITTTPEDDSDPINFEEAGSRVFTGSAQVNGGHFTLEAPMPAELSQNYRPATLGAYAYASAENEEAVGMFRNFYLYGYEEEIQPDDERPVIESMVLNHSSFRSGDTVNPSPMLIAQITDNVGINLSGAGIGHQITATLDGTRTFNDLSFYYTPNTDGTPGGIINYPFEDIVDGMHTLSLRIWDTSGNSARNEIKFNVAQGIAPKIYDIYSDANPASTSANFFLSHDQPDAMVDVTVTVYNLLGRPVWSGSASGRSDMFLSVPVSWDLTDGAGRRVGRGIYLYRATITSDGGQTFETATRRIAVTAR